MNIVTLFYDLHQTIKEVGTRGTAKHLCITDRNDWIKKITGEISLMKATPLKHVLDIYSRLDSYTIDIIDFIILHADALEDIFYENDNFIEENLKLLSDSYFKSLKYSHIITLHCLRNNVPHDKIWDCVSRCICFRNIGIRIVESLILDLPIPNSDMVNSLDLLFSLNEICPEFAETINEKAGPLHKMQMDIYNSSDKNDRNNPKDAYVYFLEKNKANEEVINRVIEYINNNKFVENKTLSDICSLDVKYSYELKASCDKGILSYPDFKKLYNTSPKISEKLSELYSNNKLELRDFCNIVSGFLKFDESEIELIETLL